MPTTQTVSLWLLCAFSLLTASSYFFGSDMYTPSLPAISHYFSISSEYARQTVSCFFIALGISQLIYGPASEKYGRKPVLILGGLLFFAGSVLCYTANTIDSLISGRLLQGFGVGALYLLCRTVLQDRFSKDQLMTILSWFGVLFLTLPAIAPSIGGVLEHYFDWRASFLFMSVLAALILCVTVFFFRETHSEKTPQALSPKHIFSTYKTICSHKVFLSYLIMMVCSSGFVILFYTMGSFIMIKQYAFAEKNFGFLSLILLSSMIAGRLFFNNIAKNRLGEQRSLILAFILTALSCLFLLGNVMAIHSAVLLVFSVSLFSFAAGIMTTVAAVSALYVFPQFKGQVGAIYGALQMLGTFLLTQAASVLPASEMYLLGLMCCLSLAIFLALTNKAVRAHYVEQV